MKVSAVDRYSLPAMRSLIKRPRLTEAIMGRSRWGNIFTEAMQRDPFPFYEPIVADGVALDATPGRILRSGRDTETVPIAGA